MLRTPRCCGEDAHDHRHAYDGTAAHRCVSESGPGWKPRGSLLAPDLPVSRDVKGRDRPSCLDMSASDPLRPAPAHAS